EFGGSFDYQAIGFLVSDGASNGNSFPSGHAVAGFCLTSLFYYFYKANLKKAYFWYGGGMLLGTILAITRLTQGGHYLSDILSSLAISQMVVTTVSRLKLPIGKYNKNLVVLNPQSISYRLKKYGIIIIFSISWGIWIFGVFFNQLSLLNTKESFVFTPSAKPILIKTDVAGVKVRVIENQSQENMIKIRFDVDARGTTFFSLTPQVILKQENDHPILYVTINKSIFIRRLGGDIDIYLPGTQPYRLLKIIDDK
nr:phosphatase PAP2 family protein [SAR324 cluster bacterium]